MSADSSGAHTHERRSVADERSEQRLAHALRSDVADSVGSRLLLPVWFATALGPATPAQSIERWLARATRALLYRVDALSSASTIAPE